MQNLIHQPSADPGGTTERSSGTAPQAPPGAQLVSPTATQDPDETGHPRAAEILRLLDGLPVHESATPREILAELEQERRRLHHALSLLRAARQRMHEQFLQNESEKQTVLNGLREQWAARRRSLEVQLAAAAMKTARDEQQDDRAQMEAEFQERKFEAEQQRQREQREWQKNVELQRQQLQLEHDQFETEMQQRQEEIDQRRRQLETDAERQIAAVHLERDEWERRRNTLQQQLGETRHKLVQVELAIVEERANQSEERRKWNDERFKAESIIRDLLAEFDLLSKAAADPEKRQQRTAA